MLPHYSLTDFYDKSAESKRPLHFATMWLVANMWEKVFCSELNVFKSQRSDLITHSAVCWRGLNLYLIENLWQFLNFILRFFPSHLAELELLWKGKQENNPVSWCTKLLQICRFGCSKSWYCSFDSEVKIDKCSTYQNIENHKSFSFFYALLCIA